jgi:hypothetical protein
MKRTHSAAFDQCEYECTEQLILDIWDVIKSYWALLELFDRWHIIIKRLRKIKGVEFYSQSELEIQMNKGRPDDMHYCLTEIESFTWYGQCIGVIHCRNAFIGVGNGNPYVTKLTMILWHTESVEYDRFIAKQIDAVANKNILVDITKIDYGHLKPVEASPPDNNIWSFCCII